MQGAKAQPDSVGANVLDCLRAQGMCRTDGDTYYDAGCFAQPALQAVAVEADIHWLDERMAQSRYEQDAHQRLCLYATEHSVPHRFRQAAELLTSAVSAGLTGALNFGAFAMVVAQVHAAINQTPAGFTALGGGRFSATLAGRQIVLNLLGALPGSLAYAVSGGISALLLRPLVDAVAGLLSGGGLTPLVAVDPSMVYPMPSPLDESGKPKDGGAYAAALYINAAQRARMARRQAAMVDMADRFNLKFGTPLFSVCHAMRLMYQTALLLHQNRSLAAAAAGSISALSSGAASAGLQLAAGAQRMSARTVLSADRHLPLFVSRADLHRIRGDGCPPLRTALPGEFLHAGRAYFMDTTVARRLGVGLPASAAGVFGATFFINVLVPLGTLLADRARANPVGAIALTGAVALLAFVLSYWSVCKALRKASRLVRADPRTRRDAQLLAAFRQSLDRFGALSLPAQRSAAQAPAPARSPNEQHLFDEMDRILRDGLRQWCALPPDPRLEPGAAQRLLEAYQATAGYLRPDLNRQPGPPGAVQTA